MKVRHIVWDWNGTLFADFAAHLAAVNECVAVFDAGPLTQDEFRELFAIPTDTFYARIVGRELKTSEFEQLEYNYRAAYRRFATSCGLTPGATELLTAWSARGGTQSLLSMWLHEDLTRRVGSMGIYELFARVDGRPESIRIDPKREYLRKHLTALRLDPTDVLLIGDSVDDHRAATEVGANVVLYAGGLGSRASLEATGATVVSSLAAAVDYVTAVAEPSNDPVDVPSAH